MRLSHNDPPSPARIEELEPRLLLSADAAAGLCDPNPHHGLGSLELENRVWASETSASAADQSQPRSQAGGVLPDTWGREQQSLLKERTDGGGYGHETEMPARDPARDRAGPIHQTPDTYREPSAAPGSFPEAEGTAQARGPERDTHRVASASLDSVRMIDRFLASAEVANLNAGDASASGKGGPAFENTVNQPIAHGMLDDLQRWLDSEAGIGNPSDPSEQSRWRDGDGAPLPGADNGHAIQHRSQLGDTPDRGHPEAQAPEAEHAGATNPDQPVATVPAPLPSGNRLAGDPPSPETSAPVPEDSGHGVSAAPNPVLTQPDARADSPPRDTHEIADAAPAPAQGSDDSAAAARVTELPSVPPPPAERFVPVGLDSVQAKAIQEPTAIELRPSGSVGDAWEVDPKTTGNDAKRSPDTPEQDLLPALGLTNGPTGEADHAQPKMRELIIGTVVGSGSTLAGGLAAWILRGHYLLLSLFASIPVWRRLDRLPILVSADGRLRIRKPTCSPASISDDALEQAAGRILDRRDLTRISRHRS